jgi:hypothetical protein
LRQFLRQSPDAAQRLAFGVERLVDEIEQRLAAEPAHPFGVGPHDARALAVPQPGRTLGRHVFGKTRCGHLIETCSAPACLPRQGTPLNFRKGRTQKRPFLRRTLREN